MPRRLSLLTLGLLLVFALASCTGQLPGTPPTATPTAPGSVEVGPTPVPTQPALAPANATPVPSPIVVAPARPAEPIVQLPPGNGQPRTVRDVAMVARDGATLATDVYVPAGPGPFPVVVQRTPYNKATATVEVQALLGQGYAYVVQDVRGRWGSPGVFEPWRNEGADGYDTVEWVAGQPWSNGKIGLSGVSYPAGAALLAAGARPPHLTAVFVLFSPGDMYNQAAYRDGALAQALLQGWLLDQATSAAQARGETDLAAELRTYRGDLARWLRYRPLYDWPPLQKSPEYLRVYQETLDHPTRDDFWSQGDVARIQQRIDVPVLFVAGWYDVFEQATLDTFSALRSGLSERARQSKLVVGPWTHGLTVGKVGDVDFGNTALLNPYELGGRWFDAWLKGAANGMREGPAVRRFVMGPDTWRDDNAWPPPAAKDAIFYLRGDGSLDAGGPNDAAARRFGYNPDSPVPTLGGNNLGIPAGPRNQAPLGTRPDVLRYQTAPLAKDLEVVGRIRTTLYVSSTAVDTDFTAKLIDAAPDGTLRNINDGIVRVGAQRPGAGPLTPEQVVEVTVDLWSTNHVFAAGHSLRLDISSSNFPRFDRNPNTGAPLGRETRIAIAENTVWADLAHPSRLVVQTLG